MIIEEALRQLRLKEIEAKRDMELSEADGNSDYDYHEGRSEAYGYAVALLVDLIRKER